PRVDRHEVEVSRILPGRPDAGVEEFAFGLAERLAKVTGLVRPLTQGEVAMVAFRRHPFETIELSVLGRPLAEIRQSESDATVVREEPGMALGHGRLGGLEVCVDERARVRSASGPGILEFVRGPGQGR